MGTEEDCRSIWQMLKTTEVWRCARCGSEYDRGDMVMECARECMEAAAAGKPARPRRRVVRAPAVVCQGPADPAPAFVPAPPED